jgi:hypothetical protein
MGRRRRRPGVASALAVALVSLVALVAIVTTALPAAGASSEWQMPVDGTVVRPFAEPSSAYAPGHRGADFGVPAGTAVHAAGAGTVSFAGDVAGALHVVVAHRNGLRTSYSFLADVMVTVGDSVTAGTVVGHSGGADPDSGHGPDTFHFGLRIGERYVDPLLLFETRDLTELVRLVPVAPIGPNGSWEHAAVDEPAVLELGVGHELAPPASNDDGGCGIDVPVFGGAVDAVCDGIDWAAGATVDALRVGLDVLRSASRAGAAFAARVGNELHAYLDGVRAAAGRLRAQMLDAQLGRVLRDVIEIGQRMIEWTLQHCDRNAPPADGTGGSGHALMAVAGIDSNSNGPDQRSFRLDTDALGYARADVHWFSYDEHGGAYEREDTEQSLYESAELLAAQLREQQAREPGRPIDLIAHSQGGVVVDIFLKLIYKPSDPSYPPLGTVVSLASPHEGAPLARTAAELRNDDRTRRYLDAIDVANDRLGPVMPSSASKAVRQLDPNSRLMRRLQSTPLPSGVHYVSISSPDDYVVPANRAHLDGADDVVVDVDGVLTDHGGIVDDPNAMRAVRAALEGRPPPCTSLMTGIRSAIEPVLLSRVETDLGQNLLTYLDVREYAR